MGRLRRQLDPSGRRTTGFAVAGVALVIVLWIAVIIVLGRVDSGSAQSDQRIGPNVPEPAHPRKDEQPSSPDKASREKEPSEPVVRAEGGNDFVSTPKPAPRSDSRDGSRGGSSPEEPAKPGPDAADTPEASFTQADRERAGAAAARFIAAAYGYTGDSEAEYRAGVMRAAARSLYDSPGGKRIDGYARTAGGEGMKSAAKLLNFEVTGHGPRGVEGVAHFAVGEGGGYNRYGEISGEVTHFRQEMTLVPEGEVYRIAEVAVEKKIRNTEGSPGEGEG